MHYISIFFKIFNKPCANFSRVWTKNANCWEILKTVDENSIEKLNIFIFLFLLENLLLKIEPSEITPFFYYNFFGFGGGDFSLPPGYALGPRVLWSEIIPNFSICFFCLWRFRAIPPITQRKIH